RCPCTPGVAGPGRCFALDARDSWTQPPYSGWSARKCQGTPGPDSGCSPDPSGPIGTLPGYHEAGLVAGGDPGVAIGPVPGPGGFSWGNGERLYYSNLTANFPAPKQGQAFKGFEGIAVSRTDNMAAAAHNDKSAWDPPVVIS